MPPPHDLERSSSACSTRTILTTLPLRILQLAGYSMLCGSMLGTVSYIGFQYLQLHQALHRNSSRHSSLSQRQKYAVHLHVDNCFTRITLDCYGASKAYVTMR